ncbi:hypothetical protein ABIC88_003118 [Pseudomonas kilonensis]
MPIVVEPLCGSELARDGGRPLSIFIDGHTAIASKLAPTLIYGRDL